MPCLLLKEGYVAELPFGPAMDRRRFLQQVAASGASFTMGRFVLGCGGRGGTGSSTSTQPTGPYTSGRNYSFQLNYIPSYGQSLSMGEFGVPAISKAQRFDSLMFAGGTRPQGYSSDLDADYGTAVPLVETDLQTGFDSDLYGIYTPGETILSGMTEAIKELMESEDSATPYNFPDYRLLGSCPGHGAYGILDLWKGSTSYARLLYEVQAAMAIAKQMSLTFGVPLVTWMQGEADICCAIEGHYKGYLTQLIQQQLAVDILAITGQTAPPLFLLYQTNYAADGPERQLPHCLRAVSGKPDRSGRADCNALLSLPEQHSATPDSDKLQDSRRILRRGV